ncbi:MDR family MFS transporter [Streptomyces bambusae]|uniref:MFS transporter n=1 Tax=Streptomyces bambusae TaxID=1550616 RepID=A0ABS6YXY9_9ACTN|nr:MFS transporter [Streptomyces bambusae]MBW5480323.1 MFS transporter [Streptomyces bambusae]
MTRRAGARLRPPAAVRGLPPAFWWIWLSVLVNWIGGFAASLLALSLTAGRGYSATYAGLVLSLVGLGGIAGAFLGGALADRIGRRTTMFAAHVWTAASMALLGVSGEPWAVAASALAMGLGATAVRPAMQASLTDLVRPEDRQRAFALNYWALNAGGAIAAVLAGLMVRHGYALVFLADAAATLLCGILVLAKVPETRPAPAERPTAPASPGSAPASGPESGPKSAPVYRDGSFMLFVLMTTLFAVVFKQGSATLPVVMTREGHSPEMYSLVIAANGLMVVALQIPLSRLAGGRSRAMVLLAAGLLLGWGFGLTMLADGVAAFACTVLIWTLGEILQAPAGIAVTADRAPADRRGRYQGMYGGAWSTAAFLAPAGGGWVLDQWGATALWTLCAVLATTAGVGFALVTGRIEDFRTGRPSPVRDGSGTPLPHPPASSGPGRGIATEGNPS